MYPYRHLFICPPRHAPRTVQLNCSLQFLKNKILLVGSGANGQVQGCKVHHINAGTKTQSAENWLTMNEQTSEERMIRYDNTSRRTPTKAIGENCVEHSQKFYDG